MHVAKPALPLERACGRQFKVQKFISLRTGTSADLNFSPVGTFIFLCVLIVSALRVGWKVKILEDGSVVDFGWVKDTAETKTGLSTHPPFCLHWRHLHIILMQLEAEQHRRQFTRRVRPESMRPHVGLCRIKWCGLKWIRYWMKGYWGGGQWTLLLRQAESSHHCSWLSSEKPNNFLQDQGCFLGLWVGDCDSYIMLTIISWNEWL